MHRKGRTGLLETSAIVPGHCANVRANETIPEERTGATFFTYRGERARGVQSLTAERHVADVRHVRGTPHLSTVAPDSDNVTPCDPRR